MFRSELYIGHNLIIKGCSLSYHQQTLGIGIEIQDIPVCEIKKGRRFSFQTYAQP